MENVDFHTRRRISNSNDMSILKMSSDCISTGSLCIYLHIAISTSSTWVTSFTPTESEYWPSIRSSRAMQLLFLKWWIHNEIVEMVFTICRLNDGEKRFRSNILWMTRCFSCWFFFSKQEFCDFVSIIRSHQFGAYEQMELGWNVRLFYWSRIIDSVPFEINDVACITWTCKYHILIQKMCSQTKFQHVFENNLSAKLDLNKFKGKLDE